NPRRPTVGLVLECDRDSFRPERAHPSQNNMTSGINSESDVSHSDTEDKVAATAPESIPGKRSHGPIHVIMRRRRVSPTRWRDLVPFFCALERVWRRSQVQR